MVDAAIQALRQQLAAFVADSSEVDDDAGHLASRALASLQSHLPAELAAKAQVVGSIPGERKQATVLFADLSGFTAVSEQADPEVIRAFQSDLFSELARIIYQHEGFVEKFIGDAVLAVFGAPVAHEDDPERALRVALAMRERMAALNRRWVSRLGSQVTLHVGINTGPVVAGMIGSEVASGGAYAVTGDTVNAASRLQNAAKPGQILVSRTTFRFARGAFTFRALEPMDLKNRREPLDVYELERARLSPTKTRGIQDLPRVFVGRDDVLDQLCSVTQRFLERKTAPVVMITAEAGIGKSRLVEEWRKRTDEAVVWLEGRCFPHTQMLSYSPLLDMLRRYAGIVDDDTEQHARQRLDRAADRLFPGDGEVRTILATLLAMRLKRDEAQFLARLSAREFRERVFSLIEQLLATLARTQPVVLFLEDMQWADLSMLDLVEYLVSRQSDRLMLVMAARPDADSPLRQLETKLNQYAERVVKLAVERLDEAATDAMVHALLSKAQLPRDVVALISDRAEGNPFFVEEIMRALIERGGLQQHGDVWTVTPLLEKISVPETLQGLIMARIDRLPDETKEVVQHAAVIGRTFLYRVLLAIAQSSPTLDADLTHLERSELIQESVREAEVEYTFRHALTQEVAYHSLLTTRRRELHQRVGGAMERIFAGRIAEYYPMVAAHFVRGEDWDKASIYFLKAAEQAGGQMTIEQRQQYEQTLQSLEHIGKPTHDQVRRRIEAVLGYCRNVILGGGTFDEDDIDRCLERLRMADKDTGTLLSGKTPNKDDRLLAARVIAWTAQAKSMGGDASETIQRSAERIRELQVDLEADLAARLGQVLVHRGHFREAVAMLRPAVSELDATRPDDAEWVHANGALAVAEAGSGNYSAGLRRAENGVRRVERLRKFALLASAASYVGAIQFLAGDWEAVHAVHARHRSDMHKMPLTAQGIFDALECSAHALRPQHDTEQLERMRALIDEDVDEERPHTKPHVQPVLGAWHEAAHAGLAIHLNRLDDAERRARKGVELARQRDDAFGEALALRLLAVARAAQGAPPQEVDQLLTESQKIHSDAGCVLEMARTDRVWGKILIDRGDIASARLRLREAQRTFGGQEGLEVESSRIQALIDSVG